MTRLTVIFLSFFFILAAVLPAFAGDYDLLSIITFQWCHHDVSHLLMDQPAKSGCCSWHDGVCGCDALGRVICCDGTISPSCTC